MTDTQEVEYETSLLLDDSLSYFFGKTIIRPYLSLVREGVLDVDFNGDLMSVYVNKIENKTWKKDKSKVSISIDVLALDDLEILLLFYGHYAVDHFGLYRIKQKESSKYFYYTHCEPDGLMNIFPCFNDYSVLIRISLELVHHEEYGSYANSEHFHGQLPEKQINFGKVPNELASGYKSALTFPVVPTKGFKRQRFKKSPILQCYQVAFAVGEFLEFDQDLLLESEDNHTVRLKVCYSIERPIGLPMLQTLGNIVKDALDSTADFLQLPVSKLGLPQQLNLLVASSLPCEGMENPGLILVDESLVKSKHATFQFKAFYDLQVLLFHEMAHLWFGYHSKIDTERSTFIKEGLAEILAEELLSNNRGEHPRSAVTNVACICQGAWNLLRCHSSSRRRVEEGAGRCQLDNMSYDVGKGVIRSLQASTNRDLFKEKIGGLLDVNFLRLLDLEQAFDSKLPSRLVKSSGIKVIKVESFTVDHQPLEKVDCEDTAESMASPRCSITIRYNESSSDESLEATVIQLVIIGKLRQTAPVEGQAMEVEQAVDGSIGMEFASVTVPGSQKSCVSLKATTLATIEAVLLDPYGHLHAVSITDDRSFAYVAERFDSIENPYLRASALRSCFLGVVLRIVPLDFGLDIFDACIRKEPNYMVAAEYASLLRPLIEAGQRMKVSKIDDFCRQMFEVLKSKDDEPGFSGKKHVLTRSMLDLMPLDCSDLFDFILDPQSFTSDELKWLFVDRLVKLGHRKVAGKSTAEVCKALTLADMWSEAMTDDLTAATLERFSQIVEFSSPPTVEDEAAIDDLIEEAPFQVLTSMRAIIEDSLQHRREAWSGQRSLWFWYDRLYLSGLIAACLTID